MAMEQVKDLVNRMLRPLRSRVYNIVSRAVLAVANDFGGMQVVKVAVLAGEIRGDVEYFQDYGFTSVPLPGAEAIILCPQGNREHMVAIKIGDRTVRLKALLPGEVAIYTDEGTKVHLKRGGAIEVVAASKVEVKSMNIELGAVLLEKILNGETFQTFFNAHTHPGNAGVPTGPPNIPSTFLHLSTTVKAAK